ncbi:oxygen-regulated protein 1-like [Hippoglossus hippoglossus]|uniref:oxygen-regulated protein 1-like n=1 Tax=Hippoglossus hippoglossus TaxID=8267 RepID=UPI00148CE44B|nr:oxygen-regulated protein 1-like [Hippoglossus hippoglossus]
MNQTGLRRIPPDQSSGSGHTFGTPRHPRIKDPILSKRVCFYKSGDPQFSGLRMVINNRTFKTFDALLDSLSKKVPLPFGVRNITTPRGIHAIYTLDELEDGKSYICSDRRKVTPINLALARKKLPPWYHVRPATARRRVVQQARSFPGRNVHRKEPVVVRTPKKLLVFCNGDPTLKRKVVLHKRTSANFESILEYISELMQFHVVKLHTPDGRRVDGLPGLILCSGTVVAAGREPFKSANYTSQKSPAPTQFSNNRKRQRRSKSLNRKKKSRSYHSSKSRNFSLSSERYIVNRIHNSMAGSSYDGRLPTNPSNSLELESVAGTDGAEGQGCLPPADDDIEKSFRVNQDGSMTVEMKVRLTLKEEETIHWTTTLSRSNVASELNGSCLPEPVADEEICSPASDPVDLQTAASSIDSINKDKTKDNNDEDPPSPSNGAFNRSRKEEDNTKVQTHMLSPTRAPTPGYKEIRKKQASVESMTEQYCVVKQTNTRPVPKPRRLGDVDNSNIKSRNISSFKSSEILQIESSGEEVTETVLHIYEQQMCQDNFLANICAHDIPPYGRPATSETGQFSSNNEFDPEFWRPSTASESISIWKTENMSLTSDLTLSSLKTGATQATNNQQQLSKSTRGKDKPEQRELNKGKRKPKAGKKRARRLLTPGKRKASLSKYTSCAEDTTASNTAGDDANTVLPNGLCSTGTHLPPLSSSLHEKHSNKTMSPNIKKRESSPAPSPSPERRKMLHKAKLQKRPSPYSQSLVMVSPPVTNMSNKKKLSRNLSTDYASEPENNTKRKTSSRRKRHQTSQAINSAAEQDETPTTLETNQTERKKTDQEKSVTQTQLPQLNIANQPNTKPVLEQICRSIKSIRQITQNQHSSCVEKSNSPSNFSSHVASTFGSSSKALLAFLSIMTLNEGINNSDRDQLNANVSCAEALKMIDSLREIANIEDSQKIKASLCNLQRSTSQQLLQSWRGFQELSDKCKSCSLTPNDSQELIVNKVIDQIIDNLDIPKKLKEELMSLSERVDEGSMSTRFIEKAELSQKENRDSKMSHCSGEAASVSEDEKTNVDVRSMIKKFANVNQPKQSEMHDIPLRTESLKHKPPAELKDKQVTEETQLHRHIEDKVSQETANKSISSTKTPEVARRKLQMQSEGSTSIPESGHTTDEESGAGEEGRNASSVSKDEENWKLSLCSSDAGEGHSCLDEEEQTQQSSNYYVELSVRKESVSSPDSRNLRLSEEERPEEPEIQNSRQGTEISVDESAGYSDADEPTTSEEEQLEFERNELKVRSEESLSGIEEEKESIDEEAQLNYRPDTEEVKCNKLQALIGEVEEISSEDEDPKNDHSSLLNSDSLAERERFSADEHGSCEEQVEMEQANTAREQIRSSSEEELSFCEKESSSEKEEHRETPVAKDRMVVEKVKLESEEIISQSVAERIILLEKQVADAQKRKSIAESPALKSVPQRNVHLESDVEESPSESLCTRSAPQSSLSFSYDSSGVITTEPEGNRVRSIREMFLAKSATDNRQGRQRFQSPNPSDLSELRADTSTSAGYQSQTSIELSSGEDDSARKSITKGFVRRTIERLYGKKDPEEKTSERPPSAPKQKKKEHSSIFSPFHSARTKAMTELSYFNSTNVLDSLTEATGCIAFNAQVGPGDSVPNDNGPWLLRENTLIRKSVSEPVAINKILANTPPDEEMCEGREQNAPNPLDSTTSEPEDKIKSLSRKCTYFSLPHASDSDVCQDDTRPASKNSVSGDSIAIDTSENAKTWGERNGILPAGGITDFRMMDNKVHPLPEVPSDGEVVVVQPGRGQGVMNRRLQEPDVLDLLYNFCGEHCPIL